MYLQIFSVLFLLPFINAQDESQARLLIHKRLCNKYLVEGRDIVSDYIIYNIGESAALNIHLKDASFPEGEFERVIGIPEIKLDRLGPGANFSHTVVFKPVRTGIYNFTAAEVTYQTSEDSQEVQVAYSTEPGEAIIIQAKDFDRKFSPHMMDWLLLLS